MENENEEKHKKVKKPSDDDDDDSEIEDQFILRLPDDAANSLREALESGNLNDRLFMKLDGDGRHGEIIFDGIVMEGTIFDLPTHVESLKTYDKSTFYKSADIAQMMVCEEKTADVNIAKGATKKTDTKIQTDKVADLNIAKGAVSKKKKDTATRTEKAANLDSGNNSNNGDIDDTVKVDKKYLWPHGLAPPFKNVRKQRFRKTLKKNTDDTPNVDKELQRLFRADREAISVKYDLIEEGKETSYDVKDNGIDDYETINLVFDEFGNMIASDNYNIEEATDNGNDEDNNDKASPLGLSLEDLNISPSTTNDGQADIADKEKLENELNRFRREYDDLIAKQNERTQQIESIGNASLKRRLEEYVASFLREIHEKEMQIKDYEALLGITK